jgi:hypothetical protein
LSQVRQSASIKVIKNQHKQKQTHLLNQNKLIQNLLNNHFHQLLLFSHKFHWCNSSMKHIKRVKIKVINVNDFAMSMVHFTTNKEVNMLESEEKIKWMRKALFIFRMMKWRIKESNWKDYQLHGYGKLYNKEVIQL